MSTPLVIMNHYPSYCKRRNDTGPPASPRLWLVPQPLCKGAAKKRKTHRNRESTHMPTSDPALPVAVSPLPAAPVRQRHTLVSLATRQNGSPLDSDIKAAASTWPANLAGWRVKGDASFWPCKCRTGAAFFICTQLLRPRFFFFGPLCLVSFCALSFEEHDDCDIGTGGSSCGCFPTHA
jgi:hypothetical protein